MDHDKSEPINNDHQKTVQGKNQRGPDARLGKSAGGHRKSKGQNLDPRNEDHGSRESKDIGDQRGRSRDVGGRQPS